MQASLVHLNRGMSLRAAIPMLLLCSAARAQQFAITDLGVLGGPMAGGFGISANRLVVGFSALPNADFHAFFWDGIMHELLPLAGDTQSHAFAANTAGQVVGVSYVLGGLSGHAVLWQGGTATNLGDFAPRGLNEAGTVVGYISTAITGRGWVDRACVLRNSTLTTLSTLGGSFSYAYDINAAGQIVGMSYTSGENARRACL
jgi:probable HAF family extracellular repeat protein